MIIAFQKNKKLISVLLLIFLVSILGVFCFKINQARAVFGFDIDPANWMMKAAVGILALVIKGFGLGLEIAVKLLSYLLNRGGFTQASVVQVGWRIMRDIANMFFVFILLVIAFATILRRETYGMKALLPKLVIAALLINFSLVIAGVIIDSSQVLTDFFISQSGGEQLLEYNLMSATKAVDTLTTNSQAVLGADAAIALSNVVIGAFLTVIFLGVIFIVFVAYGLFLIVRMVFLWFLLIFAPIVWVLWIMPQTRHLWNDWWKSFLKWCFFAPIAAFFIYLSIFSYKTLLAADIASLDSRSPANFLPTLTKPSALLQYLLVMSLLFGGLIVAQKFGIYGAEGAIGLAKGARGRAVRLGKRVGRKAVTTPIRTAKTVATKMPLIKKTGWAQKQAREREEQKREVIAGKIKKSGEKYGNWTTENLKAQFKSADPHSKAAIAKILANRKELSKDPTFGFDDEQITDALKVANQYGQDKDILNARPDLAPMVDKDIEKIVAELGRVKEGVNKLSVEALKNDKVMAAIKSQLTEKDGTWAKEELNSLTKNNFAAFDKIRADIIDKIEYQSDEWKKWNTERPEMTKYVVSEPGKAMFKPGKAAAKEQEVEKIKKEAAEKKEQRQTQEQAKTQEERMTRIEEMLREQRG